MPEVLDGRALGRSLNKALKQKVATLERAPGLAVVLVGEDPASEVYVRRKGTVAGRIGFHHRQINLPAGTSQETLLATIATLNEDPCIDGILVQLPLPAHLDARQVTEAINPEKDVDGFTAVNTGLLAMGRREEALVPCTPLGVMVMLEHAGIPLSGLNACVIGRSNIVGRPMARLLEQANCTVTVCHSRTRDVETIIRRSDLIVAAIGRAHWVEGAWVKEGAIVIDVGINRRDDGSLCGDVDYGSAAPRSSWITPVPGGVGPMTIAMLMANTYRASCRAQARG